MKRIYLVLFLLCFILILGVISIASADTTEPFELQLGIVSMGFDHMQRPMDSVPDERTFTDQLILTPNSGGLYQFALFDGNRYELIAPTDVTVFGESLGWEPISGFPDCTSFYNFWSTDHGSGEIHVVYDGKPLKLPYSVELPDMGWYQDSSESQDSYLGYPRCPGKGYDQRFYYLSKEPISTIQVDLCTRGQDKLETTEVRNSHGMLIGIAIDVPDCQVGDQIDLIVTADGVTYDGTSVIQFSEKNEPSPNIQIYRSPDKIGSPLQEFTMGTDTADRTFYVFSEGFDGDSELKEDPVHHKNGGFAITKHNDGTDVYFKILLDHSLFHQPALYFTVDETCFTVNMANHPDRVTLPKGVLGFMADGGLNSRFACHVTADQAADPTWELGILGEADEEFAIHSVTYHTYENGILTDVTDRALLGTPQITGNTVTATLPPIPKSCAYFVQFVVLLEDTAYTITSQLTVEVKTDVLVDREAASVTAIGDGLCAAVYDGHGRMTGFSEFFTPGTTLTGLDGAVVRIFQLNSWAPVREALTISFIQ